MRQSRTRFLRLQSFGFDEHTQIIDVGRERGPVAETSQADKSRSSIGRPCGFASEAALQKIRVELRTFRVLAVGAQRVERIKNPSERVVHFMRHHRGQFSEHGEFLLRPPAGRVNASLFRSALAPSH